MKMLLVALATLLLALQYRLWFGEGSVQELWRVHEEARATRAEVVRLRGRNQALRAEVADLKSGLEAIEERARTDLGMIDADEVFYQFVREGERAPGPRESLPADDVVDGAETAPVESPPASPASPVASDAVGTRGTGVREGG